MKRFILVTFLVLGWVFYEMSGGSEFDAEATRLARVEEPSPVTTSTIAPASATQTSAATQPLTSGQSDVTEAVTRVALNLNSSDAVLEDAIPERVKEAEANKVETIVAAAEGVQSDLPETQIILPSLITDTPVIQPVNFNSDEETQANAPSDIRVVTGNRVNVRGGPGTNYSVVNKLVRGDEVIVIGSNGDGWVETRPINGGPDGWMADFLLTGG